MDPLDDDNDEGKDANPLAKKKMEMERALAEQESKAKGNKGDPATKKNAALLNAKTTPYADDFTLYKPRLTVEQQCEYWLQLLKTKVRRQVPKGFVSWVKSVKKVDDDDNLDDQFPSSTTQLVKFITSVVWDRIYLGMFLLWLLVVIYIQDGWADKYPLPSAGGVSAKDAPAGTMLIPVIFMMLSQVVPTVGVIYCVARCNDLTKYLASKNFGDWAFTSVLVAQYIENFYFGGRGRSKLAGKCRYQKGRTSLFNMIGSLVGGAAKIYVEEEETIEERLRRYGFDEVQKEIKEEAVVIDVEKDNSSNKKFGNDFDPSTVDLQELGFIARQKIQKIIDKKEAKRKAAEAKAEREKTITDWIEWKCKVCAVQNREPRHPLMESDVFFGTQGVMYKRTYAIIRKRRDVAQCKKCFTFADYQPPLSSAHLFPHNPEPYRAFGAYPINTTVQAGLRNGFFFRYWNYFTSCLFGLRNQSNSSVVWNDWRLRLYVRQIFPEMPKSTLQPGQFYEKGEIVESKQQRSEWVRARILKVRGETHTYDIKYDPGDELRYVPEKAIRLPPNKGNYAYRVEMCMVFIAVTFPLGVIAAYTVQPGLIFFGPLLVGLYLSAVRIGSIFKYFSDYYAAGFCMIFKLSMVFTIPVILMTISSILPYLKDSFGVGWTYVTYAWIATFLSCIPTLYMMRPSMIVLFAPIFMQLAIGGYLLGQYLDGTPIHPYIAVALVPFITTIINLIFYRTHLGNIWDVSLVIRPPMYFVADERNFAEKLFDVAYDYYQSMV